MECGGLPGLPAPWLAGGRSSVAAKARSANQAGKRNSCSMAKGFVSRVALGLPLRSGRFLPALQFPLCNLGVPFAAK